MSLFPFFSTYLSYQDIAGRTALFAVDCYRVNPCACDQQDSECTKHTKQVDAINMFNIYNMVFSSLKSEHNLLLGYCDVTVSTYRYKTLKCRHKGTRNTFICGVLSKSDSFQVCLFKNRERSMNQHFEVQTALVSQKSNVPSSLMAESLKSFFTSSTFMLHIEGF